MVACTVSDANDNNGESLYDYKNIKYKMTHKQPLEQNLLALTEFARFKLHNVREKILLNPVDSFIANSIAWQTISRFSRNYCLRLEFRPSNHLLLILFIIGLLSSKNANGLQSSMTYVPQGTNTLLYAPGKEPIMQLDQITFIDTVFDAQSNRAFVVEFYADWCGHCRAFAPYYRALAQRVAAWRDVVQIAAINCADNFNSVVCGANGVLHFPMMKYFVGSANLISEGMDLEPAHSVDNLMNQIADKVTNDYAFHRYPDWPDLTYLHVNRSSNYDDMWGNSQTQFLLLIFENNNHGATTAFKLIFDMLPYRDTVLTRRVLSSSLAAQQLRLHAFPHVALFRRHDRTQTAMLMRPVTSEIVVEIMNRVHPGQSVTLATPPPLYTTTMAPVINCEAEPDRCRPLYFASESDMLKAMHMALLDEVARPNALISGQNFTHLYNFVSLLSEYFPAATFANEARRKRRSVHLQHNEVMPLQYAQANSAKLRLKRSEAVIPPRASRQSGQVAAEDDGSVTRTLQRSERARLVFAHMRRVLEMRHDGAIAANEWRHHFTNIEEFYSKPFPVNASWQHCHGMTAEYRGYTCALWTTFHALTVHTYLRNLKEINTSARESPIRSLKSIQGWVDSFFGCQHCRNHFMEMTTQIFPMNADWIKQPHDAVLYLWRAHNIVNKRLHGQSTEDPQFLKHQFPAPFLCPDCSEDGKFSRRKVRQFLVEYYTNIHATELD